MPGGVDQHRGAVEGIGAGVPVLLKAHGAVAAARQRGNPTVRGLVGMLLHQARPAWRSWFGVDVSVTLELRATIEATL